MRKNKQNGPNMSKATYYTLIATLHLISFLLLIYGATAFNVGLLDVQVIDVLSLKSIAAFKSVLFLVGIVGSYFTIHILAKSKFRNQ